MIKEIWKPICENYQNCSCNYWISSRIYCIRPNTYEVSNYGRIRNKVTGNILATTDQVTLFVSGHKYNIYDDESRIINYINSARRKFSVARIVYSTFHRPVKANERVKHYRTSFLLPNASDNLYV